MWCEQSSKGGARVNQRKGAYNSLTIPILSRQATDFEQDFHSLQTQQTFAPQIQRQQRPKKKGTRQPTDVSTDQVRELEQIGDVWHLKLQGYTETGAVSGLIWPSGPPPGIRISPLIILEEPVQIGLFELTGVTYDAINTMEASFAKWFFDLGLRPEPHLPRSIHTVRIWFKGFIPQFLIRGPPFYDCFIGDNRTFSSDRKATGRLNSEVLIENLDTPTPTISQTNYSDLTRQVDCDTEAIIDTATPDTSGTRFYNFRYPGAVVWDWPYPYPPAAHPPEITVGESEQSPSTMWATRRIL